MVFGTLLLVIGILVYWYMGGRALALHFAGLESRLQKYTLQGNAPKFSILHSPFSITKLPTTHYPLLTPFKRDF